MGIHTPTYIITQNWIISFISDICKSYRTYIVFTGCVFDIQWLDIVLLSKGDSVREKDENNSHTRQCFFFAHGSKLWQFTFLCSLRACSHVRYARWIAGFTLFFLNMSRFRLMYEWTAHAVVANALCLCVCACFLFLSSSFFIHFVRMRKSRYKA